LSDKARRLQRLLAIRRICEDVDRGMMGMALAAVAEVDLALNAQRAELIRGTQAARVALSAGERGDWLMADAQSEVAGWNRGRLGVLREARAVEVPPAVERFLISRREHEQMKLLVRDADLAEQIEEGRKMQAATDDWFLSRRIRVARRTIVNRS
jgi:hypothetical protein